MNEPSQPQPPIGGFCDECGHIAGRHGIDEDGKDGCGGVTGPCDCAGMLWLGNRWPRPWLPAPEGLKTE